MMTIFSSYHYEAEFSRNGNNFSGIGSAAKNTKATNLIKCNSKRCTGKAGILFPHKAGLFKWVCSL